MPDSAAQDPKVPPSIQRVLDYFRKLSREDKMQALVQYSKKLEPLPERFAALDRAPFTVPECQTRADVFPEVRDGKLYFYRSEERRVGEARSSGVLAVG